MRYIVIGEKRYEWKEILRLRREQLRATRKQQLALFEMKDDRRPASQKTPDGRFAEPTLFFWDSAATPALPARKALPAQKIQAKLRGRKPRPSTKDEGFK